jgi:hypothetical protein
MLRGFATINYRADDVEAAKRWYSQLLGTAPYVERSGTGWPPRAVTARVSGLPDQPAS